MSEYDLGFDIDEDGHWHERVGTERELAERYAEFQRQLEEEQTAELARLYRETGDV